MLNTKYLIILSLVLFSCKKEKDQKPLEDKGPMTVTNGWELMKKTSTIYLYSNGVNTFDLIQTHSEGFDIVYSSIFSFQNELRVYNVRWRAFNSGTEKVEKIVLNEIANFDPVGRPILSSILSLHSKGLSENDLSAIGEYDSRDNVYNDPPFFSYDYFIAKPVKQSLKTFKFGFKRTQMSNGIGSADPKMAFACNGMNARIATNLNNIYHYGDYLEIRAAAPKGDQLVCLAIKDSLLYVLESDPSEFTHSSGSYSETVNPFVIKNIYNLHTITGTSNQNFLDAIRYCFNDDYLNVFIGIRNGKHRYLKINLNNYSLTSINEQLYEQMNLDINTFRDVVMLNDRVGEMLSFEVDGIYHLSGGTKTFISSPEIQAGTLVSRNYRYINGYLWHLLFDENGSYLIRKKL